MLILDVERVLVDSTKFSSDFQSPSTLTLHVYMVNYVFKKIRTSKCLYMKFIIYKIIKTKHDSFCIRKTWFSSDTHIWKWSHSWNDCIVHCIVVQYTKCCATGGAYGMMSILHFSYTWWVYFRRCSTHTLLYKLNIRTANWPWDRFHITNGNQVATVIHGLWQWHSFYKCNTIKSGITIWFIKKY